MNKQILKQAGFEKEVKLVEQGKCPLCGDDINENAVFTINVGECEGRKVVTEIEPRVTLTDSGEGFVPTVREDQPIYVSIPEVVKENIMLILLLAGIMLAIIFIIYFIYLL